MVTLQQSKSNGSFFVTIPKAVVEANGFKKGEVFKVVARSNYIKLCR